MPASRNALLLTALVLIAVSALVAAWGDASVLRYERALALTAEPWRLITAHLVHLGWTHFALNALALVLLAMLFGPSMRAPAWSFVTLVCALGVSLSLWAFSPRVDWYVGLSGIGHGWVAAGAVAMWSARRASAITTLALLALKLAWEGSQGGAMPSALLEGDTVADAHLYGAVAGLFAAFAIHLTNQVRKPVG